MKTTKYCIILFICLCLGQVYAQTHDNIRMAYFGVQPNGSIPSEFYERARANGFNYILAEFYLDSLQWNKNTGRYIGGANSRLRKQLKDEFIAANQKELKLIPLFQTSSMHSGHWKHVNNNIQWQKLPTGFPNTMQNRADTTVPTFAPDPPGVNGFDTSFNELLKVIYTAFNEVKASLSYDTLEYIHFGADEPIFVYDTLGVYKVLMMAGLCQRDRDWLQANGYGNYSGTQGQIIALLGSNINRKVQMIRAAGRRYGHNTKALYYTDMLDPNHLGGGNNKLCAFNSPTSTDTTNIKTYTMTESIYIKSIRDSSIAVQWQYDRDYEKDYDTDSTFRYFKNNGLKFLHGSALADDTNPIDAGRLHQLMEQAVVGMKPAYNNHAMGYVAFQWYNIYNSANPAPVFKTMEFLSHLIFYSAALYE